MNQRATHQNTVSLVSLFGVLLSANIAFAEHAVSKAPAAYNKMANQFEKQFNQPSGPVNWANSMQRQFFGKQNDLAAQRGGQFGSYNGQQSGGYQGNQQGRQQAKTFNEMFGMGKGNTKLN
ncbi:MAG: hypothetical protein GXO35_03715, partial [Gammaproteobacteria bacterium]|nr:hypothetical protein [Gammaproteobacteria bacterium]